MTIQGKITGVRTVGVPVTDQDRALDFYVGTLGLEKRLDADMGGGRRWIEVAPAGAATSIALVRAREGLPAGVETGIRFVSPGRLTPHARYCPFCPFWLSVHDGHVAELAILRRTAFTMPDRAGDHRGRFCGSGRQFERVSR